MATARRHDHLIGISIHDQVCIVGHDDDLTSQFSLAESCNQLLKHRLRIQILFRLINDERPIICKRLPNSPCVIQAGAH